MGERTPADVFRTLEQVRAHFEAEGVARQAWPERLLETDDFPRTASGKVQKFRVRQLVREAQADGGGVIATAPHVRI